MVRSWGESSEWTQTTEVATGPPGRRLPTNRRTRCTAEPVISRQCTGDVFETPTTLWLEGERGVVELGAAYLAGSIGAIIESGQRPLDVVELDPQRRRLCLIVDGVVRGRSRRICGHSLALGLG